MEFDKSRVYTALNAEELKPGSIIVVADNLTRLEADVERSELTILRKVESTDWSGRFFDGSTHWNLAYLVDVPEEKKLQWTDLKVGDVIRKPSCEGYRFAMVVRIDTYATRAHIGIEGEWLDAEQLEEWEKVD